ncbi:sugar kinase [Pseudomonas coleopterorum]|jgi:dehydrogluconokinase|uniref:Sugar kinase n=1 Tax=Pseudomonas coleopterorum TaxID=1605838 RepID=A0AAJ6LW14_9PSED|nr:sugar kinase [Pseudomonas coleopterorum]WNC07881.1 sugar kinase [Pseudomonas coleopterorum]SEE30796.1 dehydrogluconokinase [Pseudomonas coleopterorum]
MAEFDVLSFGETMAMFVAEQTGDLADVTRFHKRIAGADNNVAIGLSRLGFNVAWLSRVGDDSLGRFIVAALQREGLDCSHVAVDPQHPTGFQFKSLQDDGRDPCVEYFRRGSAASHMGIADVPARLLDARHLHATGIPPALSPSMNALTRGLMTAMRSAGRSVSFDPNLRPSLWPSQAKMIEQINSLAALADWVLPGLAEGQLLTGQERCEDIARFYLDLGVQAVVIKLGADGAFYCSAQQQGYVAGRPVDKVVDTVGAGDGFAVGVISALLEGRDLPRAAARGNWVGSLAVQSPGDMEGLPTRAALTADEHR